MADFIPDEAVNENLAPVPEANQPPPPQYANPRGSNKFTRNTTHPVMLIVFCISKFWFVVYGIVSWFVKISSLVDIICVGLGFAIDFYICKNFAGRYLAGLRWHTYVVEGKTWYYFECAEKKMSGMEKAVFWTGMWFSPVYYTAMIIAALFTIEWLSIPMNLLGLGTSGTNLMAYLKCSKDAKVRMSMMRNQVTKKATDAAVNYGAEQVQSEFNSM